MTVVYFGVDVGKKKLDCALLVNGKLLDKSCENSPAGFKQLFDWLTKKKVEKVHACLEATGGYEEKLARALFEAGHQVTVVNPLVIKAFATQRLTRTKTDVVDARTLAEYASRNAADLRLWEPPPRELSELRELVVRRQALVEMQTQETNRLKMESGGPTVDEMVRKHLGFLAAQIAEVEAAIRNHINKHPGLKAQKDLLVSIPGVGNQTAVMFLAEVGAKLQAMPSPKQLVRYCGMDVMHRESGSSVRGKPRMSKVGNSRLRTALFMPATTAMRYNPLVAALNERLLAEKKAYKVRVGASMRKLLHLMFGVLKTQKPFDPNWANA